MKRRLVLTRFILEVFTVIDGFIRYPKIYRLGHEKNRGIFERGIVYVTEKVDGANFRFMNDGGRLRYGSRRRELTGVDDVGQFRRAVEKVLEFEPGDLHEGWVYFVEYMIPHTIQYDWNRTPLFLGIDIWNGEKWLSYDEAEKEFARLGIEIVPLVDVRDVSEIDEHYLDKVIPKSKYYNGEAEGVVFKNYDLQIFAKLVSERFKERNEKVFGKSKKKARQEGCEAYLLEKYVPPRRVEKVIQALVDEGYRLSMELMTVLPRRVLEDVIEEEGAEIFRENCTVDFRKFRKLISRRCYNVLQRMLAVQSVIDKGA